jgi:hypothetical protein
MVYLGLIFITLLCSACDLLCNNHDKIITCDSNCYEFEVSGTIVDKTTNSGIKNIPLKLHWIKPGCWFCSEKLINKVKSNGNGDFYFISLIDTSYFSKDYGLSLSFPENKDYIVPGYTYETIYSIKDTSLRKITFNVYPKAQLQIQMERVENDVFDELLVEHHFVDNYGYVDKMIRRTGDGQYNHPLNETFTTETSSDIKTYIICTKIVKSVKTIQVDSIVCKKDQINIYKLRY